MLLRGPFPPHHHWNGSPVAQSCSGPSVTSGSLTRAEGKGLPYISLLNFSLLLSKLNYILTILLTLLLQRKKDLFQTSSSTCPLHPIPPSAGLVCSFLLCILTLHSSLTPYQSMKMLILSKILLSILFYHKTFLFSFIFKLPKIIFSFSNIFNKCLLSYDLSKLSRH